MKTVMRSASVLLLAVAACDRRDEAPPPNAQTASPPPTTTPSRAAPHLVPRLAELKTIAASAPPGLDAERAAELAELVEAAFATGADPDLANRAKRRLDGDDQAVLAYEVALGHADASIRTLAAYELSRRGSIASVPSLLLRIRVEQDPAAKLWMGGAIVALGAHPAIALDAIAARFEDPTLGADAAQILNETLAAAGIPLADGASWDDARAAWQRLANHWNEEGHALGRERPEFDRVEALDPRLRAHFAQALVQLSEFQLRPVDEARIVLRNLGVLPIPLLRLALTSSETYVRAHAVEVTRDVGSAARSLEPEIVALLDDPLTAVTATQAAGLMGAGSAIPLLHSRLDGDDPELACAAAAALGEIGDETARPRLLAHLDDAAALIDLRVYCAYGLARLDRAVEGGGVGGAFLRDLESRQGYHAPTLAELLGSASR